MVSAHKCHESRRRDRSKPRDARDASRSRQQNSYVHLQIMGCGAWLPTTYFLFLHDMYLIVYFSFYYHDRYVQNDNKENDPFRAPVELPPRTPRGQRPAPLGMSPPRQKPWSSAQKAPNTSNKQHVAPQTPPAMSSLLAQSMDATRKC